MNLMRVKSTVKWQIKRLIGRAQPIDQQHPWHPLAVLVCGNTGTAAKHQVNHWIGNGFATNELARLQNLPTAAPSAEAWVAPPGMREVIVRLNSSEADHWGHHAWLDHCPIVADQLSLTDLSDPNAAPVALNLWDPQPGMDAAQTLLALATLERVWDPCKQRVQLLRRLGIRASWLRPNAIGNGYLLSQQIDSTLGLPEPQALQSIGCSVLCLGNINPTFEQSLEPPLFGIPNFDALTGGINTHQIAQWLHRCLEEKLSIVRFPASPFEEKSQTWEALVKSHHPAPSVLIPKSPLGVGDILDEFAWHQQEHPSPTICVTPTPETRCIFSHETRSPEVAVCVSLYNYAGTITSALNSAARQSSVDQLELIVVDDGSSDESRAVAEQWMKTNGQRFARCLLLEHTQNGGLAAARNTAFEAAKSSWCFVLDADNQLHTKAASHCGALSKSVDPRCGVIYPLIKILNEPGSQDARHLVSDRLWDPTLLAQGNYIDAMALVRVDAWKEVGGYTHIPGGWEDYDFWCKLVDADWHGVHCPQVLATYTSHMDSMRAKSTNRKERQLRRLLQQRHPWLQLITQQDAVGLLRSRPTHGARRPCQHETDRIDGQVRVIGRINGEPSLPVMSQALLGSSQLSRCAWPKISVSTCLSGQPQSSKRGVNQASGSSPQPQAKVDPPMGNHHGFKKHAASRHHRLARQEQRLGWQHRKVLRESGTTEISKVPGRETTVSWCRQLFPAKQTSRRMDQTVAVDQLRTNADDSRRGRLGPHLHQPVDFRIFGSDQITIPEQQPRSLTGIH